MNDQSSLPLARGRTQKDTPSGFCNLLQPGSYIHSVSDHITNDDIAETSGMGPKAEKLKAKQWGSS